MQRLILRLVLDQFSIALRSVLVCSPIILLLFSYRSPIVLLLFSYRSPIVLLSFSYRSPIVLLLGNGKQYGNNTEWSERRTKDERMRLGGTRVVNLTIIYL